MLDSRSKAYNIQSVGFLLVDDNEFMRSVVRSVLKVWGCRNVAEARDGDEALKRLHVFPADVIIADWEMAPMDGIEFTRRVRNDPKSPDRFVPIIMLTGHTAGERVRTARDAGVHTFVAKPVQPRVLYERLCELIERPRKFISCETYCGPDRGRRKSHNYDGPERRQKPRDYS